MYLQCPIEAVTTNQPTNRLTNQPTNPTASPPSTDPGTYCCPPYVLPGLRLGLYNPIKDALRSDPTSPLSLVAKLTAGVVAGSVAAGMTSPLELVKVGGGRGGQREGNGGA